MGRVALTLLHCLLTMKTIHVTAQVARMLNSAVPMERLANLLTLKSVKMPYFAWWKIAVFTLFRDEPSRFPLLAVANRGRSLHQSGVDRRGRTLA